MSFIILERFVFVNIKNLTYPNFDYKLIYSIVFGLIVALSIINNRLITIKGLIILFLIVIIGFVSSGLSIRSVSKFQISPNVISTVSLNLKSLLYIPIYPFILLGLIRLAKIPALNRLINKIPSIKANFGLLQARLFAFWIDIVIVWIFSFILYKYRVIIWFPVEILLILFAYRVIMETAFSRTIGKMIFGLIVSRNDTITLELKDVLIRNISRIIPFYWIPILFKRPALHDRFSNTNIIKNALQHAI